VIGPSFVIFSPEHCSEKGVLRASSMFT